MTKRFLDCVLWCCHLPSHSAVAALSYIVTRVACSSSEESVLSDEDELSVSDSEEDGGCCELDAGREVIVQVEGRVHAVLQKEQGLVVPMAAKSSEVVGQIAVLGDGRHRQATAFPVVMM